MATTAANGWTYPRKVRDPLLAAAGILLLLLSIAFGRHAHRPAAALSPWMIVHLATILPALPIGAFVLLRRKGDALHRWVGRLWALLMAVGAVTSFGVRTSGHLSPIHILSLVTLIALPRAIVQARRRQIVQHRRTMTILYASLVIAGYFTLLPSRLLGGFLFG